MSLIVKIMSAENLADDDTRKSYQLLTEVAYVSFCRNPGAPIACVSFSGDGAEDGRLVEYALEGNVYVMNENGKTISSFGCAPPDESELTPPT